MTYGRSNLRLVFGRGGARPLYMDPGRDLGLAEAVLGFYEEAVGLRMGDVGWEELRLIVGSDKLYNALRIVMGRFYKAVKRCPEHSKPEYLRGRVFLHVNERYGGYVHPMERSRVIKELEEELGVKGLEEAMWCDLPEELVIERLVKPSPLDVISTYNYETIDTVLVNSDSLEIRIREGRSPSAASLAKLVGRLCKLHGLVYEAVLEAGELRISIAGPGSVFGHATRYGSRLSHLGVRVLRMLRSMKTKWSISAEMRTSRGRLIHVAIASNKRTPYLEGAKPPEPKCIYDSSIEESIARILRSIGVDVEREAEPLVLPAGLLYIPDLVAKGPGGKAYIEIMGYWRKEYVEKKLYKVTELARAGIPIIIVADSRHRREVEASAKSIPTFYYTIRQGKPVLPYGALLREIKKLIETRQR